MLAAGGGYVQLDPDHPALGGLAGLGKVGGLPRGRGEVDVAQPAASAFGHDQALPVLIDLLSHPSRIIRKETLLVLCRIGPSAKPALAHLDDALAPSAHADVWSYDNIPEMIALVRACAAGDASTALQNTRQKYLP